MKTAKSGFTLALVLAAAVPARAEAPPTPPADSVVVIAAAPESGFHFPYILRIPRGAGEGPAEAAAGGAAVGGAPARFLLVEPNNTGSVSDDFDAHLRAAMELSERAVGAFVSRTLGVPFLVPVFPRPATEWRIYTHQLDRDVMLLREGPLRRPDLQLLAMIEDARVRLGREGVLVDTRVLLTGFSASGSFANRFAMLHPDRVQAVACGGLNGLLMLPVAELDGVPLLYPLGLADFEEVSGGPFESAKWGQVPQFIYMGEKDENDAVEFDDGYSESERSVVFRVIGKKMQPDRWERCQAVYRASGAAATFNTYPGVGHETNGRINSVIAEFFKTAMDQSH